VPWLSFAAQFRSHHQRKDACPTASLRIVAGPGQQCRANDTSDQTMHGQQLARISLAARMSRPRPPSE